MNKRQKQIIEFAKKNHSFQNKDVVVFFDDKYSRETITRDLSFLSHQKFLHKSGAGAFVAYSLSDTYSSLEEVDIQKYFETPYFQRDVKEIFNFEIFHILGNDIFTAEEKEKLEKLQRQFINNFSKYDSQTIINKEFERIMIEFSWKSSAIEGNTYSLLGTEALIKNNVIGKGKTKEETQMILNHKDAFNEAIQNRERFIKLRSADIEYIHSVLTKKLGITKNIRNKGVGVIGTKYRPLDNEAQIREMMQKMVNLINKKASFFEKALLVSILIAYIQIFEDGNKRTSRMISNAILLAHNSIPLSYRIVDVEEYKKAVILFYEINNISYFKRIFVEQFEDAVNNYFK
ncbi:MAG: cell filamentation protein Fic [Candidatus Komeilibacteria bacterium CG_4_10_14_0_2_um_filter_37_10]|uniref:Cell filamentation protein Fic n=1 Tax=Candidatus Komeilibacteria bacterium CG_4_10_14_0_2_um_filter_37_10 TaxID=1974470 RepID=A0A2M7VGA7_9BACT|nr:MAG: cell filamentation protein Fic [Candidatus Komeilibacteria bacterium CG_4_10_14_0_2_um_filter_37_10]